MTMSVTVNLDGGDLSPSLVGRPSRGITHQVCLGRVCTARADVELVLELTAGRAEQLADEFAELAATMRTRDAARATDLGLGEAAARHDKAVGYQPPGG